MQQPIGMIMNLASDILFIDFSSLSQSVVTKFSAKNDLSFRLITPINIRYY